MIHLRRTFSMTILFLLTLLIAACGGSTNTGTTGSGTTPTTAPTATATSGATALVGTATASVQGKSATILTNAQGKTLYYFTPDTATTSACTGSCAQAWPPLLATGSAAPASSGTLSGKLTVVTTVNGNQVAYNGHLLYTFSGDSASGQTNGEGVLGKWFVATADLAVGNSSGSTATALVKTATAMVQGKSVTILTDAQGKTLYYFKADTATTSACTGSCAQAWPPLLATGSGTPTSATPLPSKLSVVKTGNGNQVEYSDYLLYTFSGDSAPGQTNGEGVLGKWFVVTTDLK